MIGSHFVIVTGLRLCGFKKRLLICFLFDMLYVFFELAGNWVCSLYLMGC